MPRDPFAGYDAWLERPYVEAAEREEAFIEWCESEDVDPDTPGAWSQWEAAMRARADDEAERRAEDMDDREVW